MESSSSCNCAIGTILDSLTGVRESNLGLFCRGSSCVSALVPSQVSNWHCPWCGLVRLVQERMPWFSKLLHQASAVPVTAPPPSCSCSCSTLWCWCVFASSRTGKQIKIMAKASLRERKNEWSVGGCGPDAVVPTVAAAAVAAAEASSAQDTTLGQT